MAHYPGHGNPNAEPTSTIEKAEAAAAAEEERKRREAEEAAEADAAANAKAREDAAALAASLTPADDETDPYGADTGAGIDEGIDVDIPGAEAADDPEYFDLYGNEGLSGLAGLGDEGSTLELGALEKLAGVKDIAAGSGAVTDEAIEKGLLEGWPLGSAGVGGGGYSPGSPDARNAAMNALRLGKGLIGEGTAFGVGRPGTETFDAKPSMVGDAARLEGIGAKELGGFASGRVGAAMQAQRDQGLRDIMAMKAGARGPVGAAERAATQATGQLGAGLAGQAAQLQLQAAGQEAQLREAEAGRGDAITQLQAQFQQATGLSNAQMAQQNAQFNSQIDSQLAMERDRRINELVRDGTNLDIALMQVDAEMEKARAELLYREWADQLARQTQLDISQIENAPWDQQYNPATGQYEQTSTAKGLAELGENIGGFFNDAGEFISDNATAIATGGLSTLYDYIFGNAGGIVPGVGNTDTQPAMLTPGEIVIPKDLSAQLMAVIGKSADQSGNLQAGGQVQESNIDFKKAFPQANPDPTMPTPRPPAVPGLTSQGAGAMGVGGPDVGNLGPRLGRTGEKSFERGMMEELGGMYPSEEELREVAPPPAALAPPMQPTGARIDDAMTQLRGSQTRDFVKNNPMTRPAMPQPQLSSPIPGTGKADGTFDYESKSLQRGFDPKKGATPEVQQKAEADSSSIMDALAGGRRAIGYAQTMSGLRGGTKQQQDTIQNLAKSEIASQASKVPYAGKLVGPAMKAEAVMSANRPSDKIYAGRKLATDAGSKVGATMMGAPMLAEPLREGLDWVDETIFGEAPKKSRASSMNKPIGTGLGGRQIGGGDSPIYANKGGVVPGSGISALYQRLRSRPVQMRGGGVVPDIYSLGDRMKRGRK